ncbi:hypothetical protein BGY98DRAFT_708685 [Russula aff. rugulosa BPL654]|nr:hypothetical protein BGY98DRAFT_708685 [Russula aff. rugulosa BPL654]
MYVDRDSFIHPFRRFSIRVYASPDCPLVASFRENIYLYMKTLVPEMRCDANEEENGSKTVGFKSYVYCYNAFFPFLSEMYTVYVEGMIYSIPFPTFSRPRDHVPEPPDRMRQSPRVKKPVQSFKLVGGSLVPCGHRELGVHGMIYRIPSFASLKQNPPVRPSVRAQQSPRSPIITI